MSSNKNLLKTSFYQSWQQTKLSGTSKLILAILHDIHHILVLKDNYNILNYRLFYQSNRENVLHIYMKAINVN